MHCFPCGIRGSSSYTPAAKIPTENLLQQHMNPQNPVHQSGKNLMTITHIPTLAGVVEDETAHTRNIEQLQLEIDKPKPRLDVVHTLMTETFTRHRKWILEQKTVNAVIKEYPYLQKPIHVSLHFTQCSDARHHTLLVTDVWANSIFLGES